MKWRYFFQSKIDPEFWLHMQASKVRHWSFCEFHHPPPPPTPLRGDPAKYL